MQPHHRINDDEATKQYENKYNYFLRFRPSRSSKSQTCDSNLLDCALANSAVKRIDFVLSRSFTQASFQALWKNVRYSSSINKYSGSLGVSFHSWYPSHNQSSISSLDLPCSISSTTFEAIFGLLPIHEVKSSIGTLAVVMAALS